MGEIKIADARAAGGAFDVYRLRELHDLKPHEQHDKAVHLMGDEVIAWGEALKALRGTP